MVDRVSGRPRGFGFVTMGTPEEAQKAIEALNGTSPGRPRHHGQHRPPQGRALRGAGAGGVVRAATLADVATAIDHPSGYLRGAWGGPGSVLFLWPRPDAGLRDAVGCLWPVCK